MAPPEVAYDGDGEPGVKIRGRLDARRRGYGRDRGVQSLPCQPPPDSCNEQGGENRCQGQHGYESKAAPATWRGQTSMCLPLRSQSCEVRPEMTQPVSHYGSGCPPVTPITSPVM